MKPTAIIYTSNTGYTARYAEILGAKTGLPVYCLDTHNLPDSGTPILYLGWLFASSVKGFQKAAKRFKICGVCGVGLCETGALLPEVRKAISLPDEIPLFTVQGGMDRGKLKGINRFMINYLDKMMSAKKERTPDEDRMLELIQSGGNYVNPANLTALLTWLAE